LGIHLSTYRSNRQKHLDVIIYREITQSLCCVQESAILIIARFRAVFSIKSRLNRHDIFAFCLNRAISLIFLLEQKDSYRRSLKAKNHQTLGHKNL